MTKKIFFFSFIILFFWGCNSSLVNIHNEKRNEQILTLQYVLSNPYNGDIGDILLFRPDSKELMSTSKRKLNIPLYIWDLESKKLKTRIDKKSNKIQINSKFTYSLDSKKLLFSSVYRDKPEFDFKQWKQIYIPINRFGEISTKEYKNVNFHKYNEIEILEKEVINSVFGKKIQYKKKKTTSRTAEIFEFKDKYLITDSYSKNKKRGLVFFDDKTFKVSHSFQGIPSIYNKAVFSLDKRYIAFSTKKIVKNSMYDSQAMVLIYDVRQKKIIQTLPSIYNNISINDLMFLDDKHIVVSPASFGKIGYLAKDGNFYEKNIDNIPIKLINIYTKQVEIFLKKDYGHVRLAKSIGNRYFISYSLRTSELLVWDTESKKIVQKIKFGKRNFGMAVSPDKKTLAIAFKNKVYLYNVHN